MSYFLEMVCSRSSSCAFRICSPFPLLLGVQRLQRRVSALRPRSPWCRDTERSQNLFKVSGKLGYGMLCGSGYGYGYEWLQCLNKCIKPLVVCLVCCFALAKKLCSKGPLSLGWKNNSASTSFLEPSQHTGKNVVKHSQIMKGGNICYVYCLAPRRNKDAGYDEHKLLINRYNINLLSWIVLFLSWQDAF